MKVEDFAAPALPSYRRPNDLRQLAFRVSPIRCDFLAVGYNPATEMKGTGGGSGKMATASQFK
jgi:hypothetical protein